MHGHDAYKHTDIETASKLKLVVMLYSGAIRFLNLAVESIEKKEINEANTNILRAQDIVSELLASLNFDAGNIADELSNLYIYIHKLLLEGNIKKNPKLLKEAIELLENLKSGWDDLLSKEDHPSIQSNSINISG